MTRSVSILLNIDTSELLAYEKSLPPSNGVWVDFAEDAEEKKESENEEAAIEDAHGIYCDLLFMVSYIQDCHQTGTPATDLRNAWVCPDEPFEADLDMNFVHALEVLKTMQLEGVNEENFLSRPEQEDKNQEAYAQDNGDEQDSDDDLDIF